ncbi:hypothetical protein BIV57_10780 [Mangrovactinospora gilvigrisea]|uniref:histidine kinase n=1 Tax=Mangrovactinospora gilvigrisea TaxID=1428644 RepID=A0A1J7BFU5_9ACTN|nr:sensor histidine kinase [Mangrovactinospora gilvigrisea]OIV37445.1 hypothetical protein BIV57_10780 [Mangrovactinospora gilvigrisea]
MRVSRRVSLALGAPLAALLGVAAVVVDSSAGQAVGADRLGRMVSAASAAADVLDRLQQERSAGIAVMSTAGPRGDFTARAAATDQTLARYRTQRAGLKGLPAGSAADLAAVDGDIARLPTLRREVLSRRSAASAVAFGYRIMAADLVAYRDSIAQSGTAPSALADQIRSAAALSQAKESVSVEEGEVLQATGHILQPAGRQQLDAARLDYTSGLGSFTSLGRTRWESLLEHTLADQQMLAAQQAEDAISQVQPGSRLIVPPRSFMRVMQHRLLLLRTVEAQVDAQLETSVQALVEQQAEQAGAVAGGMLILLLGVGIAAVRISRRLVTELQGLTQASMHVAAVLPAQIEQGIRPGQGGLSVKAASGRVRTGEVQELLLAFDGVVAIVWGLAIEQGRRREVQEANLLQLAMRIHTLRQETTARITELEEQASADELAHYFGLDSINERIGRLIRSLRTLAGDYEPGRHKAFGTLDVVRGAISQVEQYARVDLQPVGPEVAAVQVAAPVVDDLAHLLAELLDNALAFSAPDTRVVATIRPWGEGVLISVTDQGIGIPPRAREDLNRLLRTPPVDATSQMTRVGLQVVTRLAARHGVTVEIAESHPGSGRHRRADDARPARGTTVHVMVPATATVQPVECPPKPPAHIPARPRALRTPPTEPNAGPGGIPGQRAPATASASTLPRRQPRATGHTGTPQDAAPRDQGPAISAPANLTRALNASRRSGPDRSATRKEQT